MKICLKRTGGLGGISKGWEVDDADLDPEKASELKRLLEAADFFSLSRELGAHEQVRDHFIYEVTVEGIHKKHTVQCAEPAIPKPLWDFFEQIFRAAR